MHALNNLLVTLQRVILNWYQLMMKLETDLLEVNFLRERWRILNLIFYSNPMLNYNETILVLSLE